MDHLLLPVHTSVTIPRIPFVCQDVDDDGDFLELAHRYAQQWEVAESSAQAGITLWLSSATNALGVSAVGPFLQRWIFFGLLREIFAPVDLFDASDYIERDEEGAFLHTKTLRGIVQRWSTLVQQWDDDRKIILGDRLFDCLTVAVMSISELDRAPLQQEISPDFKISLSTIVEAVSGLADARLLRTPNMDDIFPTYNARVLTDRLMSQLLDNGWCRSEVVAMQSKYRTVTTRFFLHNMHRLKFDHRRCQDDLCQSMQIRGLNGNDSDAVRSVAGYTPAHVDSTCSCTHLGPDPAVVADCLESGSFPLLKVTGDDLGCVSLEVIRYSDGTPFIALTHLWVDGLGNPDSTKLPTCQAQRLQQMFRNLRGSTFQHGDEAERRVVNHEFLFWCDTYCCPTENESVRGQTLALSRLRDVYQKASYVLVLDRELGTMRYADLSPVERVARVVTSRWSKRLWTFQESALAAKLLINFADRIVDLRDLVDDIKSYSQSNPIDLYIVRELTYAIHELKVWLDAAVNGGSKSNHLVRLTHAVRGRGISKATDEPLCLAAVLGLDLAQVAEVSPEQRMQVFWRLACDSCNGVPPGIVFHDMPRLSVEGLRWAPASIVHGASEPRLLLHHKDLSKATWTPYGLRVRRPGWRIRLNNPSMVGYGLANEPAVGRSIPLRTSDGNWFRVGAPRDVNGGTVRTLAHWLRDRSKDWYIILDGSSSRPEDLWGGLLTCTERSSDPVVHRSVALVVVQQYERPWMKLHDLASSHATMMWQDPAMSEMIRLLRYELVFESVVAWMPTMLSDQLRWATKRFLRIALGDTRGQFYRLLNQKAQEAAESPDGLEVKARMFSARDPPAWEANIFRWLTESTVRIDEYISPDHEWCVD